MSRINFPYLPTELSVKLRYQLNSSVVSSTVETDQFFGLFEYLNRKPLYSDQLFALYRRARVVKTRVHLQLVNVGTNPVDVTVGPIAYIDLASITGPQLKSMPFSTYKIAGLGSGMSKVTIDRAFESQYALGNEMASDHTKWMTLSSSSNTSPTDTTDPIVCVIIGPSDGTSTVTFLISYLVEYDVTYFDIMAETAS